MNQEMKMADKCSGCGQPIPFAEPNCPNCGRKRKIQTTDLYWIKNDGETSGPFTFSQVQSMWKAGTVKVTNQIMRDGENEWHSVSEVCSRLERSGPGQLTFGKIVLAIVLAFVILGMLWRCSIA
jgi:hypothetical protein